MRRKLAVNTSGHLRDVTEKASVLVGPSGLSEAAKLSAALGFLGVSGSQQTIAQFLGASVDVQQSRLLCSAATFLDLLERLEQRSDGIALWQSNVHSAFVYEADNAAACATVAARIAGTAPTSLVYVKAGAEWTVTDKFPEFCRSMSGVRVAAGVNSTEAALPLDRSRPGTISIIFGAEGTALAKLDYHRVPVFVATAGLLDVRAPLTSRDFDIRQHFLSAVPIVLYAKWAFPRSSWHAPQTSACLVIDDPLLKPRYGHVDFQLFLDLMRGHGFSTSIAFIPWNWRRSSATVVGLFKDNPEAFSLSIHGCDHTRAEFGIQHRGRLTWRAKEALDRMTRHEAKTGIRHDPVMVFPQGVFSRSAMTVLKQTGFIGVVNSEVMSTDPQPSELTVADFWNVAVMKYSDFPIFTRRYPSSGVGNFAFDILLGKPCIVVIHHSDCHDRCRALIGLVDQLNGLNGGLAWRSLGEVVRHSFRQRELASGAVEIEMYGSELRARNWFAEPRRFCIRKQEASPSTIREIRSGVQQVAWTTLDGHVYLEIELDAGEECAIEIAYEMVPEPDMRGEGLRYRAKAMARRYLSELRDNYVTRTPLSS